MKCWNYTLNKGIDPLKLKHYSTVRAWFDCDTCDHTFQKQIQQFIRKSWCPYCASSELCPDEDCEDCKNKSFAVHHRVSAWSPKNTKSPRDIFISTPKKFWFDCDVCGHEFLKTPNSMNSVDTWCGYCGSKVLCENEDCDFCHIASFANSPKARCLSPQNGVNARELFIATPKKFLFDCDKCHHSFISSPAYIYAGNWCPYCTGQKLCDNRFCMMCFNNSFFCMSQMRYWAAENTKSPREVFKYTHTKYWFICDCGHKFEKDLDSISGKGGWCPYCAHKKLCDQDCVSCYLNSFASHHRASFWADENKTARQTFRCSQRKIAFICERKHSFSMSLSNITRGKQWCPLCFRKGEEKLLKVLKEHYNVTRGVNFPWCKNETGKKHFPFDFEIHNGYKTLIELDGEQHFRQVRNWMTPKEAQERDIYKMDLAKKHGYSVIRITWLMVYHDKGDWKNKLIEAIETTPWQSRSFICENNEYKVFQ